MVLIQLVIRIRFNESAYKIIYILNRANFGIFKHTIGQPANMHMVTCL